MSESKKNYDNGKLAEKYDLSYYSEELYPPLSKENLEECDKSTAKTSLLGDSSIVKIPHFSAQASNEDKLLTGLTHLLKRSSVNIVFSDLSYTVSEGRKQGVKTILKGISGTFVSGQLTGILGPSGAGKSTLMNILAGYRTSKLDGTVLVNGENRNLRQFRKMSCYIMQDDCLSPFLTVKEAMHISANLKLGSEKKQLEKNLIIDEIIASLSLDECLNTLTFNLSGGQRKRLSIALELLNNPPVMFFDEPTSGLDSSSCFQCLNLLKCLANEGRTIICTIHQPSARLFEMFDHLYILADGNCIYKGDVAGLVPFLSSLDLKCPSYHNPADYVMEVASGEHGNHIARLVNAINADHSTKVTYTSDNFPQDLSSTSITPTNCNASRVNGSNGKTVKPVGFPTSGLKQFWILLKRTFFITFRDDALTKMRFIAHVIIGTLLGLNYYNIGNNAEQLISNVGFLFFIIMFSMFSAMMPTLLSFPLEMSVFIREHLNYWYSLKAYYFAKTLADIPFQIALTLFYVIIVYYVTSQPLEILRFIMFITIVVLTSLVAQSHALLIGAACKVELGVYLGPVSSIPMLLFSGFFTKLDDIPIYLQWASYINYIRYGFEGVMISIYGLKRSKLVCNEIYCPYKDPSRFLEQLALKDDMLTYFINIGCLLALFVVFRFFAYWALRIKLRQNR